MGCTANDWRHGARDSPGQAGRGSAAQLILSGTFAYSLEVTSPGSRALTTWRSTASLFRTHDRDEQHGHFHRVGDARQWRAERGVMLLEIRDASRVIGEA